MAYKLVLEAAMRTKVEWVLYMYYVCCVSIAALVCLC